MRNDSGNKARTDNNSRAALPLWNERVRLVRYETSTGEGLFAIASLFEDCFEARSIRLPRKVQREVHRLLCQLRNSTPTPASGAYRDVRSRRPVTWFRASAHDLIRIAERLVRILNQHGADLRRFETDRPPPILWQDAVQVVTRRPRRPEAEAVCFLARRHIDRRKKLERLRARAARLRVRRARSLDYEAGATTSS